MEGNVKGPSHDKLVLFGKFLYRVFLYQVAFVGRLGLKDISYGDFSILSSLISRFRATVPLYNIVTR